MAASPFKVDIDDKELREFVKNFSDGMTALQRRTLFKSAAQLETQVILSTKRNLRTRTNTLAGAWRFVPVLIKMDEDTYKVDVINDQPYAAIHEYGSAALPGGAIRPKPPRKLLAIPIRQNTTFPAFGNNVYPMPRRTGIHQKELWFHKTKAGKMFLMDGEGKPAYRLVPSTTIRPTGYITEGIKAAEPEIALVVGQELEKLLEDA